MKSSVKIEKREITQNSLSAENYHQTCSAYFLGRQIAFQLNHEEFKFQFKFEDKGKLFRLLAEFGRFFLLVMSIEKLSTDFNLFSLCLRRL